ncbi:MAG: 50S ribosomal protein L32 [Gemmatimonadota bacterium]|nr:50S ribosomal protein L32 [Gemmatimonadota bacterium]
MAVPKRRTSKSAKKKRRTHFKLNSPGVSKCSNCSQMKPPHQICPHCGYYNGREVVFVEE